VDDTSFGNSACDADDIAESAAKQSGDVPYRSPRPFERSRRTAPNSTDAKLHFP
jgi:hypothetical protein